MISAMLSMPTAASAARHSAPDSFGVAPARLLSRQLHGDLSLIDLPTLLQMMAQHGMCGTLTVRRQGLLRTLNIDRDLVSLAGPSRPGAISPRIHRPRLGEILMLHGMVQRQALGEAIERQRRQSVRQPLGDILVARQAITADDLTRALAFQTHEELQEIMHWHDGTFDFKPGRAPLGHRQIPTPIYPLVMEAARRTDEWARIRAVVPLKDELAVRVSPDGPRPESADRLTNAVLSLADGHHTAAEIVAQAGFPEFDVGGAVVSLIEKGKLILDRPASRRREGELLDDDLRTWVISHRFGFAAMLSAQLQDRRIPSEARRLGDGSLALMLTEARPRVIVLDPRDPCTDVKRVIGLAQAWGARVLVLLAEPTRETIAGLIRQGVDDVVVMPAPIERLAMRVRRLALIIAAGSLATRSPSPSAPARPERMEPAPRSGEGLVGAGTGRSENWSG